MALDLLRAVRREPDAAISAIRKLAHKAEEACDVSAIVVEFEQILK